MSIEEQVKDYFDTHWSATVAEVASRFGLSTKQVTKILMEETS